MEGLTVGVLSQLQVIHFDSQTIILAVIGMIGLFSTAVVLTTAFRRNRTGSGRYQWVLLPIGNITPVRSASGRLSRKPYGLDGPPENLSLTVYSMKTYQEYLLQAQLATTREEALKILKKARKLELLENDYQYQAFKHAIDH